MNIVIRDIRPEDALEFTRLMHETWLATYPNEAAGITRDDIDDRYKDRYTEEAMEKRRQRMANPAPNERMLVATIDSKIVGVACMVREPEYNQLQSLYVLPSYQGKGVGRALWNEVIKLSDPTRKTIVQVAEYNKKAIAFYEKLGFRDNGKRFSEERFRMKSGGLIPEMEMDMPAVG